MQRVTLIIAIIIGMIAGVDTCWGMIEGTNNIKIFFCGDANVGKTQIINRIVKDKFDDEYQPTIIYDIVKVDNEGVGSQIWDTSGNESYKCLMSSFLKNAQIVVFVYDITNRESFKNIDIESGWFKMAQEHSLTKDNCVFVLVGNKTDLENDRQVTAKEAQKYAADNGMTFCEVSAKYDINIDKIFDQDIIKNALDLLLKQNNDILLEDTSIVTSKNDNKKCWLCDCCCC